MINVHIMWDFDAAIGQTNATFPYKFNFTEFQKELDYVNFLLDFCAKEDMKFVFAITGFTGEEGVPPYQMPGLIRQIYEAGHEVASHTWRHEYLPYLLEEQVKRTLQRSKETLERCTGVPGSVTGFVPPHNRPTSFIRQLRFGLGDRSARLIPFYKADIGYLIKLLKAEGYKWSRFTFAKNPLEYITHPKSEVFREIRQYNGLLCLPNQFNGFGQQAIAVVERCLRQQCDAVITGHPNGLSFKGPERMPLFIEFMEYLKQRRTEGKISICTVQQSMNGHA